MLYYLAVALKPYLNALNIFTYHTVRAGGAAMTGFLLSLFLGPIVIRWLRALKIGQHIRKEHVADLHALHQGKSGTPTMGGVLIILATLATLLLWARLNNRLLLLATGVLCLLGGLGFADDYLKILRKHNRGLSARAKFAGQIVVGLGLGVYLCNQPIATGAATLAARDVLDWQGLVTALRNQGLAEEPSRGNRVFERLPETLRAELGKAPVDGPLGEEQQARILAGINRVLLLRDLHDETLWKNENLNGETKTLLGKGLGRLNDRELARLNRLLLESAFPTCIALSPRNLHTRVEVPGFKAKAVLIPLGAFYALFVMLILIASSNAVNLTDGLDGLAIGASVISLLAYTAISYVVSRADWSQYLLLIHVPEASELTVFGAAMIGTGLGFLWFNSHPAEVFMGDTGSLSLGGAIGTMAVLTKQELLLPVVGGLFVLEAASVIIQVVSFKLSGRRVFRMAPLHHHFELSGWSESKVIVRFWIMAILFALMSLTALKLR